MALIVRKAHGAVLNKMMLDAGLRSAFIFGEASQTKRDKALLALEKGTLDVLIGSTILDVGVDVPAVGQILLGGGGKAEVALRQRIGRGLREKKNGPNVCFITDYRDRGNKYLQDHSIARQGIIAETPGFAENIRVLDWIIGRLEGTNQGKASPVGTVPESGELNTAGIDVDEDTLEELLEIDSEAWTKEVESVREFFEEFGERMPKQLFEELAKLEARVKA
jgi:hypothetical protein